MKTRSTKNAATKTLQGYGEDRLIAELTRALPRAETVRVGVGDDCAVIGGARAARWTLLKTDAVVEGVHFHAEEDYRRVGWKALCRAISDIAAMGGSPEHALVTVALPVAMEVDRIRDFYAGLKRAAKRFGVSIVGGETARSPGVFFCSITLTGSVERARCVLRSGGRAGDAIYVTGRLGGSLASGKHLDFTPRLAEARWLTENFRLTAMMDLSDGLGADLPRLAKASRCGFTVDVEWIPRSPGVTTEEALCDGEDFELLFCLPPKDGAQLESSWRRQFPRLKLTRIGALTSHARSQEPSAFHGFDHFA